MSTNVQEVWKEIKGYEGLYEISNMGRVKSLQRVVDTKHKTQKTLTIKEVIKKHSTCHYGYSVIMLYKDNKPKMFKIHRLIAIAFMPNPNNYPFINHKDGVKNNNDMNNLEWCTAKMNCEHARATGLNTGDYNIGKVGFKHHHTMKIQCLATGLIYTMGEAAKFVGVSRSAMCLMLKGKLQNWTTFIYG